MKRTISVILALIMLLNPLVFAIELDVAEEANVSVELAAEVEEELETEAVLSGLPELTDANYGDLIYFSDFDENTNVVNTAVVGEGATASYQLGYDADAAWGSNKVDDPAASGRGMVEKLTTGTKYKYYDGIYPTFSNFNLSDVQVTVVIDVYVDAETAASVTDPRFYIQTASGFSKISSASYDLTTGGWQTIVLPYPVNPFTFEASQNINTMFGFAETGKTYYIDNFRVYAKQLKYAEKPAEVDLNKGFLVFFDNGNEADAYNNSNMFLVGQSEKTVADGYVTRGIWNCTAYSEENPTGLGTGCATHGLVIRTADGSAFAYADGTAMNGTIRVYFDMYNGTGSDLSFYSAATSNPGGWDSWAGIYTCWGSQTDGRTATNGTWSTVGSYIDSSKSSVGVARTGWDAHTTALDFRSAYAYYMPANRVVVDGTLVDLNGLENYTLPAVEGYDAYIDADGVVYNFNTAYAVANLNGKTLTPVKYGDTVAPFTAGRGILVYFDNGNAADFYSNINATLVGYGATPVIADGYVTRDLTNAASAGISGTVGIGLDTGNTETKFAYADGTDMKGALYLVVDMYNGSDADNSFYRAVRTNWDSWCGVGTDWKSVKALTKQWTDLADAFDSELSFMGFADTNNGGWQQNTFRRVWVYYMPNSKLTIDLGNSNYEIVDLTGLETYTFPEREGYDAYKDANGNVYDIGTAYAVEDVIEKVFTPYLKPVYAEKPAETTEDGELVFFYNGNDADTVNTIGAKVVGGYTTGVYDGYNVTYTVDCTALLGACASHGIAVAPEAEAYTKNGKITLVVEFFNNMGKDVTYTAFSNTQLGAYKDAWDSVYANYGCYVDTTSGNWYTLKAVADTANNMVGFFERAWINHANLTRGFKSVAVYFQPYTVTIDGEVVELTEATYTLPVIEGTAYDYYKDADGNKYYGGTAYTKEELDGKTLTTVNLAYGEKVADFNSGRGILVYFDNGNAADFYSNINANLVGQGATLHEADGYITRDLTNPAAAGISGTVGIGMDTGNLETKFAYADGTDMNGALYFVVDMYNTGDDNTFQRGARTKTDWDEWCGVQTPWGTIGTATKDTWTLIGTAYDSELSFFGYLDKNGGGYQGCTFRRVWVYYMPNNRLTISLGNDNYEMVDLNGLETYTFAEREGYDSYKDADGNVYTIGTAYAVADINDKVFSPYDAPDYATKPAETTEDGELVFFYNGNDADTVNTIGAKVVGAYGTGVYDGYNVCYTVDCTALLGACASHGIAVAPEAEAYTKNGKITVIVEQFNNMGKDVTYAAFSNTQLGVYKDSWSGFFADYDNQVATSSGNWYTLKAVASTDNKMVGFFERAWVNHANLTRGFKSVAVYFQPYTVTIGEEVIDISEAAEYTLPAGEGFNYYKSTDGVYFEAGKAYPVATLNGKVLTTTTVVYADMPAAVDVNKGFLVYFDNGNAEDAYNDSNIELIGATAHGDHDGYFVRGIFDCTALMGACSSHGLVLKSTDGGAFTFADGTAMNGVVTAYFELYNGKESNVGFNGYTYYEGSGWSAWCGGYTAYGSQTIGLPAVAGQWNTIGMKVQASWGSAGLIRNGWDNHNAPLYVRSAYAYYMPNNYVIVNNELVDLTGLTEYTLPSLEGTEYECYLDSDGKEYAVDTYAVADINGKTFTPGVFTKYAEKPADYSAGRGILVYFDNGNEADFYSNINATFGGYDPSVSVVVDGYYTRDLSNPAAVGISGTVGVGLDTGDAEVKLAYADGTDMKGAIYLVVDMYNGSDADNYFYRAVRTNWDSWCGVGTDWTSVKALSKQWTNVANAFDSELSFIGFADTDAKNWQSNTFRRVYAYYMPNNRLTISLGNDNYEMVDLNGLETYTFAEREGYNAYKDTKGNIYYIGTPYAVEKINDGVFTPFNAAKSAEKPAAFTAGRGILVYFDNGNPLDFYSNINATLVGQGNTLVEADGYYTRELTNPAAAGISGTVGIGLDTGDLETKFAYADGTDMDGSIYFVVEMYNNSDADNGYRQGVRTWAWDNWCGVQTDWAGAGTAKAREWSNISKAFQTELSFIGVLDSDGGNWQQNTFRSAYAYYMPNTKFTIDLGNSNYEVVDLTGLETYTFAAREGYDAYRDRDTGAIYEFNTSVAVADIKEHVIIPFKRNYAAKPAATDPEKGILVFFDNGNADDALNLTNMILVGQSGETIADGFTTRGIWDCVSLIGDCSTHGLAVKTADAETPFAYTNGTVLEGTINFFYEVYNGTAGDKAFFPYSKDEIKGWDAWCGGYTPWSSSNVINTSAKAGEWTTLGVFTSTDATMIGAVRSGWNAHDTAINFRSAYVYYMPDKHVVVNGELVDLSGMTEYTMPEITDENNNVWAGDNGVYYNPGQVVAVEEVKGVKFVPSNFDGYEAETTQSVDMKASSNKAGNGIRFKAQVSLPTMEDGNEFGFIVARADVVNNYGGELTHDAFGEDAKGSLFLEGVAYNKDLNREVINSYDEDGNPIFSCVCVGFDINNKKQVTNELVVRPYIKLKFSGENTYVYGEAVTYSYAQAAKELKAAAEAGDVAAANAYNSAKEYIDTIIATADAE